MSEALRIYLDDIKREFQAAGAREHAYRPAMKKLLESLGEGLHALNEPGQMFGDKPDFALLRGDILQGTVEAKDLGINLDQAERGEQLKRYLQHMPNLLLSNYLEFRWYVEGERRAQVSLGKVQKNKIVVDEAALPALWQLLQDFIQQVSPTISHSQDLARLMAKKARSIAFLVAENLSNPEPSPRLQAQLEAFRQQLLPALSPVDFGDMYAQTLVYGLFAARLQWDGQGEFTRQKAYWDLLPKTNPLLTEFFSTIGGRDLDPDQVRWYVDNLVDLMQHIAAESILADFGRASGQENIIIHFYETFLAEYDPRTREQRGVYYTPQPVVDYMVRGVDHLLKTRFQRPQGLADPHTYILDPATGTGTFLHSTVRHIHQTVSERSAGAWQTYVRDHLLKRVFGFELLIAPYTIAHFHLARLLQELNYQFAKGERVGIFLTNSLDQSIQSSGQLGLLGFIEDEAKGAAAIKDTTPIMVVLGNPPYTASSLNKSPYIAHMLSLYKTGLKGERNLQPLSNDYVKFIRMAQERLSKTGFGIVAFITPHSYINGVIFRGMRQELQAFFDEIYILNLHGNADIQELSPEGVSDQNVFNIMTGVSIIFLIKLPKSQPPAQIHYADLWGKRQAKYEYLEQHSLNSTPWESVKPSSPYFFFSPHSDMSVSAYQNWWGVHQIFKQQAVGLETGLDEQLVRFRPQDIQALIQDLADPSITNQTISYRYGFKDSGDWHFFAHRQSLIQEKINKALLQAVAYRPFDQRYLYYHPILRRMQSETLNHLLQPNLALVSTRLIKGDVPQHFFVSDKPTDRVFLSGKTSTSAYIFPLYLYRAPDQLLNGHSDWPEGENGRVPNLNPKFVAAIEAALGLPFVPHGPKDGQGGVLTPEAIFHYAYAIFHSPTYRARYAEFLKIDFPRLPLTTDKALFWALVGQGERLAVLHLMQAFGPSLATYPLGGDNVVAKGYPKYEASRVYINQDQYFEGIPSEVWEFQVGGYQVLHKWLKDRGGQVLSYEDINHYQNIAAALAETQAIMTTIDELIPAFPLP
jgi:predicted helicase